MKYDDKTGLIPAIVQDNRTGVVLMMAYMNEKAFEKTIASKRLTFWSRSRNMLWTKGETSGNYLDLISWSLDCDKDTLLIKARPHGPACHTGSDTCWSEPNNLSDIAFIAHLEAIIDKRYEDRSDKSYTSALFEKGTKKIAQKVGEESVELILEAMDHKDELFLGEAADLLFHLLVLLRDRKMSLKDVIEVLRKRHK